jgi:hypothetical protein
MTITMRITDEKGYREKKVETGLMVDTLNPINNYMRIDPKSDTIHSDEE